MHARARVCVGEIASSVRNGAYAPYMAFYFFTKEEEQKLTDSTNRVRQRCIRNFAFEPNDMSDNRTLNRRRI